MAPWGSPAAIPAYREGRRCRSGLPRADFGGYGAGVDRVDRFERLTNVVLLLLDTPRPLSLTNIADSVGGYPPPGPALRRAFERDKALLREEGIPITTIPLDGPEQYGYLIRPEEYYLADLGLDEQEQVALNMAVSAVHLDGANAAHAPLKLGILAAEEPLVSATLPSVPWLALAEQAARDRRTMRIRYKGEWRSLDPYGLVTKGGAWYLVGRDHDRDALRRFRMDRIEDRPTLGEPESFEVPPGFDLAEHFPAAPWQMGEGLASIASIAVDAVVVPEVAAELGSDPVGHTGDNWPIFQVEVTNLAAFRSWVMGLLDHAKVLGPPELVEDIVMWLSNMAAPESRSERG